MELIEKLANVDTNYIAIALIVLFFSLEQILNTQFDFKKRPKHLLLENFPFYILFFLGNLVWAIFVVFSIEWLNEKQIGLFYLIELPIWLKLILGVAMIDMVTYWFHRMAHNVPLVWRFHRVHHSDTSMDSSTYFRGHPVEIFLWFGISNIIAAGIFGLDLMTLSLYYVIATPFFVIEHVNLKFPKWLDRTLGLVITTPNLHKVHHEQDEHYTNSNYADIFILWDRIFGTYKYKPTEEINLGLKEFDHPKKQTFWYLLKSPFIDINE